jgi:voltage-gated potassium channel
VAGRRSERALAASRRQVTLALLRAALTSTVLVVLYYTVPVTGAMDASATALLLAGLLVFVVVITWQVRAILGSRYPALRAVEALASAIPLFLLLFALVYLKMADAQAQAFSEPLTRTDSLYFTVTVFSTVGFGDITPKTQPARVMTMVQMLGDLVVVGLVLQVMVGAVKAGLRRREAGSARFAESSNRGDAGQIASPYVPEQGSEP